MDTIYKLNGSVQALGKDTQTRVHSASTGILSEVEKVQVSISIWFPSDRCLPINLLLAFLILTLKDIRRRTSE